MVKRLLLAALVAFGLPAVALGASSSSSKAQTCAFTGSTAHGSVTVSGNTATGRFTIPQYCPSQTVSLVSYSSPSANGKPYSSQKEYKSQITQVGPGTHSLSVAIPSCYYQIDLVKGSPMNFSGGQTYHAQHRFLAGAQGGSKCTAPPANHTSQTPGRGGGSINIIQSQSQSQAQSQSQGSAAGQGGQTQPQAENQPADAQPTDSQPQASAQASAPPAQASAQSQADTTPVAAEQPITQLPDTGATSAISIFGATLMIVMFVYYRRQKKFS